jgi:hypothetical protein
MVACPRAAPPTRCATKPDKGDFMMNAGGSPLMASAVAVPPWWTSREPDIQAALDSMVARGDMRTIAVSAGGRRVVSVRYGTAQPEARGTANFNSAMAARRPDAFRRRGRGSGRAPVMVLLAGVHGQEIEGMVAALSVIRILETGRDLADRERPELRDKLSRLRVLVIPLANPDGRARVPYDGWVGLPTGEMTRWGQGTRRDGEPYGWPGCKAFHPMKGDVGILGGYYDDDGVNLMHDEWTAPMSPVTGSILGLARAEAPDMLVNLHSHGFDPQVLSVDYVPVSVRKELCAFAESRFYPALERAGHAHAIAPGTVEYGGPETGAPSFNLDSILYHTGGGLVFTYESPHGVCDGPHVFGYEDILDAHHILVESVADRLLELSPV